MRAEKILGSFGQWYAKECIFEIQDCKPLGTGWDFSQDCIAIVFSGMEGGHSFIYDPEILNHLPGSVLFFTGRIGVLHSELVGTNSPQARNLLLEAVVLPEFLF